MSNAATFEGILQSRTNVVLANDFIEILRAIFTRNYFIIHIYLGYAPGIESVQGYSVKVVGWLSLILRHIERVIYRCFLPDLTGFDNFPLRKTESVIASDLTYYPRPNPLPGIPPC